MKTRVKNRIKLWLRGELHTRRVGGIKATEEWPENFARVKKWRDNEVARIANRRRKDLAKHEACSKTKFNKELEGL